jgi:hypothetical protein
MILSDGSVVKMMLVSITDHEITYVLAHHGRALIRTDTNVNWIIKQFNLTAESTVHSAARL